jgi:hypothetical protein
MAVIVQRIVGSDHAGRFYPTLAGVGHFPAPDGGAAADHEGGIAALRLGLGPVGLDGGGTLRIGPRQVASPCQLEVIGRALARTQQELVALDLGAVGDSRHEAAMVETRFGLDVAETDGTLERLASTSGFPLCEILEELLTEGNHGMGAPVEIEFAVDLRSPPDEPGWFGLLQIRPVGLRRPS